jgi:hypothetical protein
MAGVLALALAGPVGSAQALRIQVVNHAHVKPAALTLLEQGWQMQLNHQVSPWWKTPRVAFTSAPAVYRLIVVPARVLHATLRALGIDGYGIHSSDETGPYAMVGTDEGIDGISSTGSHELIEMLANPYGNRYLNGWRVEPCDPVVSATYYVWPHGKPVFVQDFVTPRWMLGGPAPWDQDRATSHPGDLTFGQAERRNRLP